MDGKEFAKALSGMNYAESKNIDRINDEADTRAKANEPEWSHFGDVDIMTDDDFVYENEGLADAINGRGGKEVKDVVKDYFSGLGELDVSEKDGKVYLVHKDDPDSLRLEILPENFSALEAAAKRHTKPIEEKPKSYADMSDEELDKSETKLLNDIFEGKKPEDTAVEKTTVKVEGNMPEDKKEDVAEKIAKKSSKEEVMPAEEFDKLIDRKPDDEEELDNDVEAVMDMVYKLPPEKAAKILDRLNGLNLKKGEVPSDKNVKEGC